MVEFIEAARVLIVEFGALGILLPLGAYGYTRLSNRQEMVETELQQVEKELVKTEVIEKDIQKDIKEIKDLVVQLQDYIIYDRRDK